MKIIHSKNISYDKRVTEPAVLINDDIRISDAEVADITIKRLHFPKPLDPALVRMSAQSIYSTAFIKDGKITARIAAKLCKIINTTTKYDYDIIDATANVGGNTIPFILTGLHVMSIERDPMEFTRLKNNVDLLNRHNVVIKQGSCLDVFKQRVTAKVVYFDPPWGGPKYKMFDQLILPLDKHDTCSIINKYLNSGQFAYVILKAPRNVYLGALDKNKCVSTIEFFYIRNQERRPFYNLHIIHNSGTSHLKASKIHVIDIGIKPGVKKLKE
jgi:predicted RNA methylase